MESFTQEAHSLKQQVGNKQFTREYGLHYILSKEPEKVFDELLQTSQIKQVNQNLFIFK